MISFKTNVVFTIALICLHVKAIENDKPQPAIARTEIRVAKSLNPEDTQTLNVMTRDGNVAQLIVKRRDGKSKLSGSFPSTRSTKSPNNEDSNLLSNWKHGQSLYLQPNMMRLDSFALLKNASNDKPHRINAGGVGSSDRMPYIPKAVNVRSRDIFVKPSVERKKARSIVEIDSDGIPVVHGVRVPDDESDEKVWRNARVINGELVPYEKGYKPPAAVPIGELVYASKTLKDTAREKGIGPYLTSDNFQTSSERSKISFGPYSVKDNNDFAKPTTNVRFGSGEGPYTIADNSRRLIDYIKEINAKEVNRDYFSRRKLRSYDTEAEHHQPQIQRRMLEYSGAPSYPNSVLYSSPTTTLSHVNFNEGVRTPILQYAHPEFGVQPAKASKEEEEAMSDFENGIKDGDISRAAYVKGNEDLESGGRYAQSPYYASGLSSIDYYKNYPYNGYYLKPKVEQPFWIRLSESIKDNVQSGFDRVQQLTRPVFDPIVEATHKITHNLGLSHSPMRAQDKVGIITPMGSSIILPALGLVAGGAALGLGAAAVGRFLQPEMRGLRGVNYPNDIFVIMEESNGHRDIPEHTRLKRSLDRINEQYLQDIAAKVINDDLQHLNSPHLWADTPCSKKLFCEVMVKQNSDDVLIMEKKMVSLLSIVHPAVISSISQHLDDVMNAVKQRDCSKFLCSRRIPIPIS